MMALTACSSTFPKRSQSTLSPNQLTVQPRVALGSQRKPNFTEEKPYLADASNEEKKVKSSKTKGACKDLKYSARTKNKSTLILRRDSKYVL